MSKISKIWEQYGKKLQIYKSKWSNSFYIADFKYYPNISYHTGLVKSMCKINKNLRRIFKVVVITKDIAAFIRKKLPNAKVYKTMKSCGSKRGTYFVEETNAVLKLISQYKKTENVIEEYPVSK